jgi:hypothetical protein
MQVVEFTWTMYSTAVALACMIINPTQIIKNKNKKQNKHKRASKQTNETNEPQMNK